MTATKVTVKYEIYCQVCKHKSETDVEFCDRTMVMNVPSDWTCVPQDEAETGALRLYFYCPIHTPADEP